MQEKENTKELSVEQCWLALSKIIEHGHSPKGYRIACMYLVDKSLWPQITEENAFSTYRAIFYAMLGQGRYEIAAALTLPEHRFNLKARSARRVWELCSEQRQLLIMGGGAVGKSFTFQMWLTLDYILDPENTLVNVISVTKGHSKGNMFGEICKTFKAIQQVIRCPGEIQQERIVTNVTSDSAGIFLIGLQEGEAGVGRFRGLHPKPRTGNPHPKFGPLTRVRHALDEAELVPSGIWKDIGNALITLEAGDVEHLKIFGSSNPIDPNSEYGQRCEPSGGWLEHQDEWEEWDSARGWHIYRIDPAKTENVVERKLVCPGMVTYEGFVQAQLEYGEGSASWWSQCRGMFPPAADSRTIISNYLLQRARGEWIFEDVPVTVVSLDSALSGGDRPTLTFARFGLAAYAAVNDKETLIHSKVAKREVDGKLVEEVVPAPRQVVQFDYQLQLPPGDSIAVAESTVDALPNGFNSLYFVVDGTGSGDGVKSALKRFLGDDLLGIVYSERATDTKVMVDDDKLASEVFKNVRAELWWGMRRWLESKLVMFGNAMGLEVMAELSGIRGQLAGGKYVVEKKEAYKKRNRNRSPDLGDSAVQVVFLVRMRGEMDAGVFEDNRESEADIRSAVDYISNLQRQDEMLSSHIN